MSGLKRYLLKILSIVFISAVVSTAAAHEFSEINQSLPEKLQLELLNILAEVNLQVSERSSSNNAKDASLAEQVLLYSSIYEEQGRQYLLEAIANSELADAFEPAPYSTYIETLSGFLYDYENNQTETHDGDHNYSPGIQQQLTELQQEIEQWLQ